MIHRRSFIFGMAATAVALAVPTAIEEVIRAPAVHRYLSRRIDEVMIAFDDAVVDEIATVDIVLRGQTFLHVSMGVRSVYRWIPVHGGAPLLMEGDPFEIAVSSRTSVAQILLSCADKIDEGPRIALLEQHTFPSEGRLPPVPMFLEMDNSLEARLKREADAKAAAAEYERKIAAGEIVDEEDYDIVDAFTLPSRMWS